jgi:ribosomal protein S18 acetylase RimI-like enzyme
MSTMAIEVAALAQLFNEAFADYLIPFPPMTPGTFQRFLSSQGVDLEESRLVYLHDQPVGFGFIHRSGGLCRLAGMGVIPRARRRGAARTLLDSLLREACERGDRQMTLEVFEQNPRALDLYHRREFKPLARLFGWSRDSLTVHPLKSGVLASDPLEPVLFADIAGGVGDSPSAFCYPNLPWQISLLAVPRLPPSVRAYRIANNLAIVAEGEPGTLRWCTLLPLRETSNPWDRLRAAAAGVLQEFPMHRWMIPAVFPESYGDAVFGPLGFSRESLNQWHLHRTLNTD